MNKTIRLTHVITDLDTGGAEMMLFKLLKSMDRSKVDSRVISLTGRGAVGDKIAGLGIEVQALGMQAGRFHPGKMIKLAGLIKDGKPDLVQTWMYHADLFGGLATLLAGTVPVLWNIRNSTLDPKTSKFSTRAIVKANALLSHILPRRVLICSTTARRVHEELGFSAGKMVWAPNGFDLSEFRPQAGGGIRLRGELDLPEDSQVVGWVGRFDPQKDIPNFIAAARIVAGVIPGVHFVMCGQGINRENAELAGWIVAAGLGGNFHLLGRRNDIARVTAGFDLAVSSSAYGEAFSNVIGEAMACGVPCVATDVGDAAEIIGSNGAVVPPRSPEKLAGAVIDLLNRPTGERLRLGAAARERIMAKYDLEKIAALYQSIYSEVLHD